MLFPRRRKEEDRDFLSCAGWFVGPVDRTCRTTRAYYDLRPGLASVQPPGCGRARRRGFASSESYFTAHRDWHHGDAAPFHRAGRRGNPRFRSDMRLFKFKFSCISRCMPHARAFSPRHIRVRNRGRMPRTLWPRRRPGLGPAT